MEGACSCYVKYLAVADRFGLRRGAHGLDCPQYRESGDKVDRKYDERFRRESELTVNR